MLVDAKPADVSRTDLVRGSVPTLRSLHATAIGLAGSSSADRFCFWRGRSGRRYVFSVYRPGPGIGNDDLPRYADAVVLAVRRTADGARTVSALGDSGPLPETSPMFAATLELGSAGELHIHLLAGDRASRRAVLDDLAHALHPPRSVDHPQQIHPIRA